MEKKQWQYAMFDAAHRGILTEQEWKDLEKDTCIKESDTIKMCKKQSKIFFEKHIKSSLIDINEFKN